MSSADPIDRVLWGIAEAAGRYSPAAPDAEQRLAWSAIEGAVADARRTYEELQAAAESSAASEQAHARAEAASEQAQARAKAASEKVQARYEATLAEVQSELQAAMIARAEADAARAQADSERDALTVALQGAKGSRDVALVTLQRAESQRDSALAAVAHAEAALSEIADERDKALAKLHERQGPTPAVIDLPVLDAVDVTDDESDDSDAEVGVDDEVDITDAFVAKWRPAPSEPPPPSKTPLDGPVIFLQVGATFANLLPHNLGTLLVTDARVIRQEGRLAAVLALPSGPGGRPTQAGEAQAARLRDAGYRVDWSRDIHMAS